MILQKGFIAFIFIFIIILVSFGWNVYGLGHGEKEMEHVEVLLELTRFEHQLDKIMNLFLHLEKSCSNQYQVDELYKLIDNTTEIRSGTSSLLSHYEKCVFAQSQGLRLDDSCAVKFTLQLKAQKQSTMDIVKSAMQLMLVSDIFNY